VWEFEVLQDGHDHDRVGDEGDDPHGTATRGAEQRKQLIDTSEQHRRSDASGVGGARLLGIEGGLRPLARAQELGGVCLGFGPADAGDGGAEFGVRGKDAVVAVAMDARGRYEASDPLEELNRREHELGAAVGRGLG